MGCTMCADKDEEEENKRAAEKAEKEEEEKKEFEEVVRRSGRKQVFAYDFDGDENGFVYFLGTKGNSRPYQNPAASWYVSVSSSAFQGSSDKPSKLCTQDISVCSADIDWSPRDRVREITPTLDRPSSPSASLDLSRPLVDLSFMCAKYRWSCILEVLVYSATLPAVFAPSIVEILLVSTQNLYRRSTSPVECLRCCLVLSRCSDEL